MNKTIFHIIMLLLLMQQQHVNGQRLAVPVIVSGKVIAGKGGLVVNGANIHFIKSGTQTISRDGGGFAINLTEATDSLVVSYIGFETRRQTINADRREPLVVVLEETTSELENVQVSTGYQQLPKERATGSFAIVSNAVLNQQVGSNILNRLEGVTNGVLFPGKSDGPTLFVRGLSTINGNKMPLIIVDNFPYEGDINNINPNEVEQVTILKDAAAASIWGARASNGVIVITTKKGKADQPMKVAFNANIVQAAKPDLYHLPQLNSSDYIDLENMLYAKGYYNREINHRLHKPLSPVLEILLQRDNGSISATTAVEQINNLRKNDVRSDYEKYFYRTTFNQLYALNLSGGTGKLVYYLSGGYDNNAGTLHQTYQRWNIRSDNTYKVHKNLQLSLGFTYTRVDNKSGRPEYNQVLVGSRRIPYLSFADASGKPMAVAKDYRSGYTDTAGRGKLFDWNYYPLEEYQHNNTKTAAEHQLAIIGLQWRINNDLRFDVKYQYERQQTASRNLQDIESYAARNMVNRFSQPDYVSGLVYYGMPAGGILNIAEGINGAQNLRGHIDFNKQWGRHAIAAIAGGELREIVSHGNYNTLYGYNNEVLSFSNVDFINPYPVLTGGGNEYIPNRLSLTEQQKRIVSFYTNIAYTFNNRYTLSASGRKDASNVFGVKTNDKWNPLWSAGVAWDISKEPFYKLEVVNKLKLRATYGYGGNMDPNRAAVTTLINLGQDGYTNFNAAQVDQFANPDLRWEITSTFNAGIDFSTFKHRLLGSIDYYNKKSKDLFGPQQLDYTAGLNRSVIITNMAAIEGHGVDIQLLGKIIEQRNIGWQAGLLFSYSKSNTTRFYRAANYPALFIRNGNTVTPIPGKPLYSIYSYAWGGLNTEGNPQGYLKKQPSTDYTTIMYANNGLDGLVYGGSALPVIFGSLSNTIKWKGLSLTANIIYKLGYYYRRESINYEYLFTNGIGHPDYAQRWQQPGDELNTSVPSLVYPLVGGRDEFYNNSAITVHKADNIRLQFVNLSYDFTAGKKKQQYQVYFNAGNLGILWQADKGGPDPDYNSVLPPVKTFAIGVRGNF